MTAHQISDVSLRQKIPAADSCYSLLGLASFTTLPCTVLNGLYPSEVMMYNLARLQSWTCVRNSLDGLHCWAARPRISRPGHDLRVFLLVRIESLV
eukprot:IDg11799t1